MGGIREGRRSTFTSSLCGLLFTRGWVERDVVTEAPQVSLNESEQLVVRVCPACTCCVILASLQRRWNGRNLEG